MAAGGARLKYILKQQIKIAIVGKYTNFADSYKSLYEALIHAGIQTRTRIDIVYIDAETIEHQGTHMLTDMDGILVPGGFGQRVQKV